MIESKSQDWLVLLHQLPTRPPYLRVKVWRRLQAIGAVAIKTAAHILPRSEANEAALRSLIDDIVAGGGEAVLIDGRLIGGQTDAEASALFDAARDADYDDIVATARRLIETGPASGGEINRLRKRLDETVALDFFGAHGRQKAEAAIAEIDRLRHAHPDVRRADVAPAVSRNSLRGRVWVTRGGVHVDRIACAWLIRRFIDPDATFRFVDRRSHSPENGELRFDMTDAEFTHEDDRCSFETLLLRAGPADDPALAAIAEMIHELDIGDGKFDRPEASGLGAMLAGICASTDDDMLRIARGSETLDQFHAFFSSRTSAR
ncbi:chromate resistance protein ChrB domain-containing protein [Rhizorhabdus sp. FW153]|uniref:chromate resistance protein ChrB domain-containing protein n=1 Tax=Rhizorhabdus sp. FW153 TaxID=3400216 RepID=UPI003CEA0209